MHLFDCRLDSCLCRLDSTAGLIRVSEELEKALGMVS